MIQVGIIGSTGYTAGELIRILMTHPEVEIKWCFSQSAGGEKIAQHHPDLFMHEGNFTNQIDKSVDVIFLCLGHGNSKKALENYKFNSSTKIIDLSNDFRLSEDSFFNDQKFAYGLPEANKEAIQKANAIANPGCFATAIQLALIPALEQGIVNSEIHVHGITGSTGAGKSPSSTSHFSWRNNNISIYKLFTHQHLAEVNETLSEVSTKDVPQLNFVPMRGDFTRGIFISLYFNSECGEDECIQLYKSYYADEPFVHVTSNEISLKQVVNTNYNLLQIKKIEGKVHITSIIDNLVKGASGQAVQNMNLMFGIEESTGLKLKSNYF